MVETSPKRTAHIWTLNRGPLLLTVLLALIAAVIFANRTYRTLLLLRAAQTSGQLETSTLRGWMTLDQIIKEYRLPDDAFLQALALPKEANRNLSLRDLARQSGRDIFRFVRDVQDAIARTTSSPLSEIAAAQPEASWFQATEDFIVQSVIVYGYPALSFILLLGSIGLPVPTGLATSIAGAAASRSGVDFLALLVIVGASTAGDLIAYWIGYTISPQLVLRYGSRLGYSTRNHARIEGLFARWGIAAVLLTRTLASHLSSVASILAGFHRFSLVTFSIYSIIGRTIWTSAYFGLGYVVGTDLKSASGFLGSLGSAILAIIVLGWALYALNGKMDQGDGSRSRAPRC